MEVQGPRLAPLSDIGNMAKNWQEWKQEFQVYLKENNCVTKSQDLKVYILKENIGKVGLNVIQNIISKNPKDGDNMNILLEKLDDHFKPCESEVKIRYYFFKRRQRKNESIENYIEALQVMAKKCNFGHLTNSLIRDKVILNINDEKLLNILMTIEHLDLFKLVVHYNLYNERKNSETSKKDIASANNVKVDNIDNENAKATETKKQSEKRNKISRTDGHDKKIHCYSKSNNNHVTNTVDESCKSNSAQFRNNCRKCDQKHPLRCCPAWGFKCGKCGDHNHYTQCCRMYVPKHGERNMNTNINAKIRSLNNNEQKDLKLGSACYNDLRSPAQPSYCATSNLCPTPTAPPLHEVENVLYPNLKYMKNSKGVSHLNVSETLVSKEKFQKNEAPQLPKVQVEQYNRQHETVVQNSNTIKATDHKNRFTTPTPKNDSCRIA